MRRHGYSLVETLFASALIACLLAGMAELVLGAFRAHGKAGEIMAVTGFLSARLEKFKSLPFDAADLQAGDCRESSEVSAGGKTIVSEWHIETVEGRLKTIDLRVFFEGTRERAVRSVLALSKDLGF